MSCEGTGSKRIVHDYKDYGLEAALLEGQQHIRANTAPTQNDPFPVKLHWMLEQTEEVGLSHVTGWSPHGRAFAVHDRESFVENVLPIYFNQTKITSFQRQCSLYGFKRITKGPDSGSYYHPQFLRTSRTFVRNIVRTKVKNDGPRKAAAPEAEPDFYSMPRLPEPIRDVALNSNIADAVRRPSLIMSAPQKILSTEQQQHHHQLPFTRLRSPSFTASTTSDMRGLVVSNFIAPSLSSASIEPDLISNRLLTKRLIQQQQQQLRLERIIGSKTAPFPPLADRRLPPSPQASVSLNTADLLLHRASSNLLNELLPNNNNSNSSSSSSNHSSFSSSTSAAIAAQQSSLTASSNLVNNYQDNVSQTVSEMIFRRAVLRSAKRISGDSLTKGPN